MPSTKKRTKSNNAGRTLQRSLPSFPLVKPSAPSVADRAATVDSIQETISGGVDNDDDDAFKPESTTKRVLRSGSRGAAAKATAKDEAKIKQTPAKKKIRQLPEDPDETIDVEDDDDEDDIESDDDTWETLPNVASSSTKKEPHPNGRVEGRHLVLWHRPRMMEKLLLHLQYECHRAGIDIPWEDIAKRLSPGATDEAVTQYLAKVRGYMITEGHLVPPPVNKMHRYRVRDDPNLRGYIRDMTKDSPHAIRSVGWNEYIEDRAENLEVPGVYRGSGIYRKYVKTFRKTLYRGPRTTGGENGSPADKGRARVASQAAKEPETPKSGMKKRASQPTASSKKRSRASRGVHRADYGSEKATESESAGESDADEYFAETPSKKRKGPGDRFMTPPRNLPVKLNLSPELLSKFPPGESRAMGLSQSVEDDHDGLIGWPYPGGVEGLEMLLGMMVGNEAQQGLGHVEQTHQDQIMNDTEMNPYMGGAIGDVGDAGTMNRAFPNIGDMQIDSPPDFQGQFDDLFQNEPNFPIGDVVMGMPGQFGGDYQSNVDGLEVGSGGIMPMVSGSGQAEDLSTPNTDAFNSAASDIDWNEWTTDTRDSDDADQ